ncbi:hypothetical protein ACU4GD_04175 [Cupriavidus basilensis]
MVERLAQITGQRPHFVEGDVRDRALLDRLFTEHPDLRGDSFRGARGGLGESVSKPLDYYEQ